MKVTVLQESLARGLGLVARAVSPRSTLPVLSNVLIASDEGRLRLSADVFGSFYPTPRVKLTGAFAVYRTLYVLAGIDDALNPHEELPIVTGNTAVPNFFRTVHYGRDYFGGIMLQFNDEDLSTLLRLYGALLIGLL